MLCREGMIEGYKLKVCSVCCVGRVYVIDGYKLKVCGVCCVGRVR